VKPVALAIVSFLTVLLLAPLASADVKSAYQREFALLEAEKHSLTERLSALDSEMNEKTEAAKAEIDRLQGRVLSLNLEGERLTDLMSDVEQQVDTSAEDGDIIDGVLQQASALLGKADVEFPEATKDDQLADAKQLRFAFANGVALLNQVSAVRKQPGEFFAANGEKVSGTIVHLGQIASYGVADGVAGALAPAGDGSLKVWPDGDTASIAKSIAGGEEPSVLRMFLYDNLDKGIERKEQQTVVEHIDAGGFIGWVIVVLGAIGLLMVAIRAYLLWAAAANTNRLVESCTPLVEKKSYDDAIGLCNRAKSAGGRVLAATLKNLHRDRDELEDIVSEAVLHETPTLDRFSSLITVIAAVAPLLGLLGTVTGMIATFDIITEFGTGNPKLLSGGIAIALITTELGLIVAIPMLILGNLLSSWANGIKDGMDKAALRIVNVATGVRLSERPPAMPSKGGEPVVSGA
jgi:biopolymer transport protein ExbB